MKINKIKITPQLHQSIVEIAATLPPVAKMRGNQPVYKEAIVRGDQIKPSDLKPGTPWNPTAMYKVNQLQYEDHVQNMIAGVKKHGTIFMMDYKSAIEAQYNSFVQADAKAKRPIERIKKVLKQLIPWKKQTN